MIPLTTNNYKEIFRTKLSNIFLFKIFENALMQLYNFGRRTKRLQGSEFRVPSLVRVKSEFSPSSEQRKKDRSEGGKSEFSPSLVRVPSKERKTDQRVASPSLVRV